MASWNTPTFDTSGFLAAILSTTAQAALNVFCKRALVRTNTDSGMEAQTTMAALAFCFATIVISIQDLHKSISSKPKVEKSTSEGKMTNNNDDSRRSVHELPPLPVFVGAIMSYHIEYALSFLFLTLVKPITFGTCDALRRLGIIICGRKMFGGERFSLINYLGMGLALFGALCYSISSSYT